jgi:hypothetical protein
VFDGEFRNENFVPTISVRFGGVVNRRDGLLTWAVFELSSSKDMVCFETLLNRTRVAFAAILFLHEAKVLGLNGPVVELFVSECSTR